MIKNINGSELELICSVVPDLPAVQLKPNKRVLPVYSLSNLS